jgi:hypothetical protein
MTPNMTIDPTRSTPALDIWLARATRRLARDSAAQVRAEIAQHYESAREDALATGATSDEADRTALAALGNPKSANSQYREVLLTCSEARLLRSSAREAHFFSATPTRKRLLILVPAVAATCAAAAYAVATVTAPFVIPFVTSASANATATFVARVAIAIAILTAIVLAVPLLPIYTPVRARFYRAAKWFTVIGLSLLLWDRANFREWSWLVLDCFSFIAWIEVKRTSLRRKIPASAWPKHLYL